MNFEHYYKNIAKLHITSETNEEMRGHCPFHNDEKTSFSVNKKTGLWKCFGSCSEGGNIFQFHAKKFNVDSKIGKDIAIRMGDYKTIPLSIVQEAHKRLIADKDDWHRFLIEHRGLNKSVMQQYMLGIEGNRLWIPILDDDDYVINIRKWKPHTDEYKIISYAAGYGTTTFFPMSQLSHNELYLMEGEMDCLLALSLKLNAITITNGAGAVPDTDHLEKLRGKVINICYDIDDAGQKGAKRIVEKIQGIASKIRVIKLPITEPKNGDFTDYIIEHKHSVADFKQLVEDTPFIEYIITKNFELDDNIYDVELDESAQQDYYNKKVRTKVIVAGKDLAPYFAPQKLTIVCKQGHLKCSKCPMRLNSGKMEIEFSLNSNKILEFIRCTTDRQKMMIQKQLELPNCSNFNIIADNIVNIEEIRAIPEINYSNKDKEYVTRHLYVVGHGIKTNRSYELEGIVVPDPNTQYVTQLITKANPTQSSVDQFKMTDELYERLKVFQIPTNNVNSLQAKMWHINNDLTYNITKIYGREDLITAVDLVYHSVLQFKFQNQIVQKGWVDGLIIGDTRCGKTESLVQLIQHYKLGELCTGENISYAGLVGGMSQAQQRWSISWGKIPLNDRRLVVLDEVSSLSVDTISNLSALRSSGIAEIIKIQTERTNARTRLIWVSNPRSGRKLDTYNYGVLAIKELIGRVEDIARFDFAISMSSNDVSMLQINAIHNENIPHKYTSELCNQLILWAWSRKVDQIRFTPEAESLVLKYALSLSDKYSSAISLIEGAEQRIKIAKLAVAIAARTFSTDDGEIIIVRPEHVEFINSFLDKIYSKPAMGYDMFSNLHNQTVELNDNTKKQLCNEFNEFINCDALRILLLESIAFRKNELADQMGYDSDESRKLFKWLSINRLIKATPIGYVKQPMFTAFLKGLEIKKEDNTNEFNI